MRRTLSVGDVIKARPCIVSINHVAASVASGECRTCGVGHLISVPRYEDGQGPWQPLDFDKPEPVECIDCGLLQTHRVCELCYENPTASVSSLSRTDLLTVLHAWFQADFGDYDAMLAAERLAARLGLEAAQET